MPFGIAKEQTLGFRSESLLLSNQAIILLLLPSQSCHMFPLDVKAVIQHAVPVVVPQEPVRAVFPANYQEAVPLYLSPLEQPLHLAGFPQSEVQRQGSHPLPVP